MTDAAFDFDRLIDRLIGLIERGETLRVKQVFAV